MRKILLLLLGVSVCGSLSSRVLSAQTVPAAPATVPEQSQPVTTQQAEPQPAVPQPTPPAVKESRSSSKNAPKNAAPPKPATDSKAAFIIGPEDVLAVRVWDEPGLSGQVSVGPDGMISLQLIHEVKAAGLTTVQLEAALTEQFKVYRNNPDVSVQVINIRSQKYIIQGGVSRPGTYPLTGPTQIMDALVNGNGFKEFANPKKIYVLRMKPDGTAEKLKFNYKDVSQGKHMEQNIYIKNGDQIIVPE